MAPLNQLKKHFQQQSAINAWPEITGYLLLGPYEEPPQLSDASYLQSLKTVGNY
jgi:hypothetical protein